jgi:dihydrofolate reductase
MKISLVVAASENNVIGKDNKLLWHLPNDLKFFKNTTWAMPVIMGRKTFQSVDNQPLPGRLNIILTRHPELVPAGTHTRSAATLEQAIEIAGETDAKEVFVCGGGEIYAQAMPLADAIILTRVHASLQGDAYFPEIDQTVWNLFSQLDFPADEKHAYAYSFQVWERKKKVNEQLSGQIHS